ncbi:hypothetical protein IP69_19400 [Bosea sp. AAP35]|nr:hypothetical protein IP69_19400 [Bosea sp. AAP35]
MENDRITRIARALCRSARIDPDSVLVAESADDETAQATGRVSPSNEAVPAWTQFRGAALTFVHTHDERVVAPL